MHVQALIFFAAFVTNFFFAQTNSEIKAIERKGFIFGFGLGAGSLSLSLKDSANLNSTQFSTTLPNIKMGYMLNNRLALILLLPGANYKYKNKDRGFEGFLVAGQYWLKNKWWVLGGTGLTFDAPAFYTVKDPKTAGFYTGSPSFTFASGYEILQKKKFAIDLQYRAFYGKSNLLNGSREGFSNMLILGFNWY